MNSSALKTIGLLLCSNIFMTMAWYGHLRFKAAPLILAILGSWLLALPEYALQVPANRIGFMKAGFSAYQLKILQECITLAVFMIFAWIALGEKPEVKHLLSFAFILAAVLTAFR